MSYRRIKLLLIVVWAISGGTVQATQFADCLGMLASNSPDGPCDSCFYEAAERNNLWDEAADLLRSKILQHPEETWLRFNLARIEFDQGGVPEQLFRSSADDYIDAEALGCAVPSLLNLADVVAVEGRVEEAWEVMAEARARAAASDDTKLQARVRVQEIRYKRIEGKDLTPAYSELQELYIRLPAEGGCLENYWYCRDLLFELGKVTYQLGRDRESLAVIKHLVELLTDKENLFDLAAARFNLATKKAAQSHGTVPKPEEVIREFKEALAAAKKGGNRRVELDAHLQLGRLLPGAEGLWHFESATRLEPTSESMRSALEIYRAAKLVDTEPAEARKLLDSALVSMVTSKKDKDLIYSWWQRLFVDWKTLEPSAAIESSLAVLDHLEALRTQQSADQERAEFFGEWVEAYHWLAGKLFEEVERSGEAGVLQLAFEITERMRARVLLDAMSGFPEPTSEDAVTALDGIVRISRELLAPNLSPDTRASRVTERRGLRLQLASEETAVATSMSRDPVTKLEQIEAKVPTDTAILSFQFASETNIYNQSDGGAWVLVTTRGATQLYRLSGAEVLEPRVSRFLGLLRSTRPLSNAILSASSKLYDDLLGQAMLGLPPEVRQLVIVPDGLLHLVPFSLLGPEPGSELVERFEVSIVPSVYLWEDWNDPTLDSTATLPALILADPGRPIPLEDSAMADSLHKGAFGPLPAARREGRLIRKHLGPESQLLMGQKASESRLKTLDSSAFAVLHFAAHAVADLDRLDHSAILLAGDPNGEDGLLHPAEIAAFDLPGSLVVLAACQSADGKPLRGEGVMSLARPFFEAGASVVVASLWTLSDRASEKLFDGFYERLAQGLPASAALRAAKQDRKAAGAPARDWAGMVLLGNGRWTMPVAIEKASSRAWFGIPLLIVSTLVAIQRLRHVRQTDVEP